MEYQKVKTAIVGCGQISDIFIRNLKDLFRITEVTALCNRTPEKAVKKAERFGIPRVMTLEEIAADPEIELVVNLTGPTSHYEVLKQMLEAGKHVFTEKMFTTDLEQSRELVELARRKGLYIGVTPDTVLGAGIQTARHVMDAGLVGDITSGFVSVSRSHLLNSEVFRFLRSEGGALPCDVGIYYIGALIALLGPVTAVCGMGAPAPEHRRELRYLEDAESWTIPGNNVVCAALRFESGALVSLHFDGSTVGDEQSRFELRGTRGMLKLGDPDTFGGRVKFLLPENEETDFPFTHGYDGKNYLGEPAPFDGYGHRGLGAAELAYAIRQGRPNRLSGEYGLHCQEILYGIDRAAQTGETYELTSRCGVRPLKPGHYSSMFGGRARGDAELSLMD